MLFHLKHQHFMTRFWQTHQPQTSAVFGVSIFHIMMIWSVTNVTQTIVWCNHSESRSEVRVQFSKVYLSISCNSIAACASQAKKTLTYVKAQAQTRAHVIFHLGSGLPPYQAEKTVVGGGELHLCGPEFPLKELNHMNINQMMCVCGEEV